MKTVSDPQISPEGSRVAYVQTTLDRHTNAYHSRIWVVPTSPGEEPKVFTSGPHLDFAPRWSPDGSGWRFYLTGKMVPNYGSFLPMKVKHSLFPNCDICWALLSGLRMA